MSDSAEKSIHVTIHGRVQGVFFRAWTKSQAKRLGLTGFVRNRRGGTVEAVFTGPAAAVDQMVERCQGGPNHAQVTQLESVDQGDSRHLLDDAKTFRTLPTE